MTSGSGSSTNGRIVTKATDSSVFHGTLHGLRNPATNRLLAEAFLTPGGEGYVRAFDPKENAWFDFWRDEGGEYHGEPETVSRPDPVLLVCPDHGFFLAAAHLAPGEVTVVRGYCRGCAATYVMLRAPTRDARAGDLVVFPTVSRQIAANLSPEVLAAVGSQLLAPPEDKRPHFHGRHGGFPARRSRQ